MSNSTAAHIKSILTPLEEEVLLAIINNDFQEGDTFVGYWVWMSQSNVDMPAKQYPGVCSSLSKKDFAWFNEDDGHSACITQKGLDALIGTIKPKLVEFFKNHKSIQASMFDIVNGCGISSTTVQSLDTLGILHFIGRNSLSLLTPAELRKIKGK